MLSDPAAVPVLCVCAWAVWYSLTTGYVALLVVREHRSWEKSTKGVGVVCFHKEA